MDLGQYEIQKTAHYHDEITTPPPPPRPYAFGYAAGRFPGHIDRTHTEISDGEVVKGIYFLLFIIIIIYLLVNLFDVHAKILLFYINRYYYIKM